MNSKQYKQTENLYNELNNFIKILMKIVDIY